MEAYCANARYIQSKTNGRDISRPEIKLYNTTVSGEARSNWCGSELNWPVIVRWVLLNFPGGPCKVDSHSLICTPWPYEQPVMLFLNANEKWNWNVRHLYVLPKWITKTKNYFETRKSLENPICPWRSRLYTQTHRWQWSTHICLIGYLAGRCIKRKTNSNKK